MSLIYNISPAALYNNTKLQDLDNSFLDFLSNRSSQLCQKLLQAREQHKSFFSQDLSALLIEIAPHLEAFIIELFQIPENSSKSLALEAKTISTCRKLFIIKTVARIAITPQSSDVGAAEQYLQQQGLDWQSPDFDASFAAFVLEQQKLQDAETKAEHSLQGKGAAGGSQREGMEFSTASPPATNSALVHAVNYAHWATFHLDGRARHRHSTLFAVPQSIDQDNLIPDIPVTSIDTYGPAPYVQHTTPNNTHALAEANYCLYCHNRSKDSCSTGYKQAHNAFTPLNGCPLDEKISEMNWLKKEGGLISPLAIAMVDNPMLAATGHRICNDCMKACIYQKQQPVDIPLIETNSLEEVLDLPWGFEIYSLLSRWNPLNLSLPFPRPDNGYKVLVVGLGPAGFAISHHLLQQGCTVVAIDGTKLEPLPAHLSGIDIHGRRQPFVPVRDISEVYAHAAGGFGGVMEYGITQRWNKKLLTVLRLMLERRENFRMYGSTRFGSNLQVSDLGDFDHVVLAMGAGKPKIPDLPNILSKGARTASDFLMSLHLKHPEDVKNIAANMQMRMPIVVIGGGLTAVDAAVEAGKYYLKQLAKFYTYYQSCDSPTALDLSDEDRIILKEFLTHASQLQNAETEEDRRQLLEQWGGVKILYRRQLNDSPSYRLNHEELRAALCDGVQLLTNAEPVAVDVDQYGHCQAILYRSKTTNDINSLPARSIIIAAGTEPNTVIARETSGVWSVDESGYFTRSTARLLQSSRDDKAKVTFMLEVQDSNLPTFSMVGDLHPNYAGNVVKALASSKHAQDEIIAALSKEPPRNIADAQGFFSLLDAKLLAHVVKVERLTPTIIEIVIDAPQAAHHFQPGQFYRLQTYNSAADSAYNLATEELALTGAGITAEGYLSLIVLELGSSSILCSTMKRGQPVALMGPTGSPTEIPQDETVLLIGGGLGNAVLFSIAAAMRARGCRIIYFAAYRQVQDLYKVDSIRDNADFVVWCCQERAFSAEDLHNTSRLPSEELEDLHNTAQSSLRRRMELGIPSLERPEGEFESTTPFIPPPFNIIDHQNISFCGNVIQTLEAYAELSEPPIHFKDIDRIITIGSASMMAAVTYARQHQLKRHFKASHHAIGSINSPMQCMMKEICGQCIQQHRDPKTGEVQYVYSCFNQDQELDRVNFAYLTERLQTNALQEKISREILKSYCQHQGQSV